MPFGLIMFIVCLLGLPALAQAPQGVKTSAGRAYVTYVDGESGTDITANIQAAIDAARASHGGTVVLPPGDYVVSDTIQMAGTLSRFPKDGPKGITLTGAGGAQGTTLNYRGKEFTTVIDMAAPWGCTIANLTIDADNKPGVVGIRYRGGYDRQTNGGKNNVFENLILQRMDIGIWIGDPFGPDLVGSSFRSVMVNYCRICVMVEGANVTGMAFYNLTISNWNEAGIKLIGHTARRVRDSAQDVIPQEEEKDEATVVRDAQTGKELFRKDIPAYALEHRTFTGQYLGNGPYLWAGGGAPDITLYSLTAHGKDPSTWAIDSNWGVVRLYSARIEGPSGIFRRTSSAPGGRFADYLMDVNATSPGGLTGNDIEYHGRGPLYLIGGTYEANIALGNRTVVYDMGVRYLERKAPSTASAYLKQDFSLAGFDQVKRTGKTTTFPGRRGTYDIVSIQTPRDLGYRQLPGTSGSQIHRMTPTLTRTVAVVAGQTQVAVKLEGMDAQGSDAYQAVVTPTFNAGNVWISGKRSEGFVIQFTQAAPAGATFDVVIRRAGYDKELR